MNFSLPLRTLVVLLSLGFSLVELCGQAPPPATPTTSTVPEIAQLETLYQKEVRERVESPHQASMKRLADGYRLALDNALKKTAAQGLLDESLAVQNEGKRFAESGTVPEADEPGTNADVAKLRTSWRAEASRLEKVRTASVQPLLQAHIARLRALEKDLTRALKLEEAKAVRSRTEALVASMAVAATPPPPARPIALAATPAAIAVAAATPRPGVAFAPLVRPVERMDLYASANNGAVIYINNKEVLKKVMRDNFSKARVGLREGDIIAVKSPDRFSDNFIWVSAVAPTGEFLFESSLDWIAYVPKNHDKWWDIKNVKEQAPVTFFNEPNNEYVKLVRQSASKTPTYRGTLPIHNPIKDESLAKPPSYCYHIVTKEDVMPKPAAPKAN